MKNTILYLIFILTINSCFNEIYCQQVNETCYSETDLETPVQDRYRYVSIGVGPIIFIPNVGIGLRKRQRELGVDSSLSFSTIGYAHQLSAHLVGHYYISPCKQNSVYLGFGIMGSVVMTNDRDCGGTLSPDFVFGKELTKKDDNRHFIEMHVAIPTLLLDKKKQHSMYLPLMYIKYGFAF